MLPIRVLVVDDSAVVRKVLCEALSASAEVQVAGTASSGSLALAKIPQLNPDIVTLDVEMPGLNGIETLSAIRQLYPRLPVIMCSTLTEHGAAVTLEALARGASDYVTKPGNSQSIAGAVELVRRELLTKILALTRFRGGNPPAEVHPRSKRESKKSEVQQIDILAIGTSTGGPNALAEVIPRLPGNLPVPVVIVQHMPPLFTRLLAERLNSLSKLSVREGEAGKLLQAGQVWIARGDHHMTVERAGAGVVLNLDQNPPENYCRPAVDVLFRSVAQIYGPNVLAVVMTGMGSDGARGAAYIQENGGEILVQDEASSVVWGMPGAIVRAGTADKVCPLEEISEEIVRRVHAGRKAPSCLPATAHRNLTAQNGL